LTPADAQIASARFRGDWRGQYELVEITESVVNTAMRLAETHTLRGYDAVQLAAALELQTVRASFALPPLTFICADGRLNAVASAEGLSVEDPNLHP
jgi:predicted nucleic acid-binding protein